MVAFSLTLPHFRIVLESQQYPESKGCQKKCIRREEVLALIAHEMYGMYSSYDRGVKMPRGKAYTKGQKEFIVTLKQSYDQERLDGETVSTKDAANRVAKGLNVSLRTVKSVLAEYHRTGNVVSPSINRGKPAFRILSPLETVIRHRIRESTTTARGGGLK